MNWHAMSKFLVEYVPLKDPIHTGCCTTIRPYVERPHNGYLGCTMLAVVSGHPLKAHREQQLASEHGRLPVHSTVFK
jgi:hypothetical protein